MSEPQFSAPMETVRKRKLEATQRLLGDTIGMDEDQWRAPSLLPGCTRAHVAVHLARGADALARIVRAAQQGRSEALYPDPKARFNDLERGIERTGLDLQIDLDTSAGELNGILDSVTDWSLPVIIGPNRATIAQVPMARLRELVVHHIDLACGFTVDDIDPVPARWLLQWYVSMGPTTGPRLAIESDSGVSARLGDQGEERRVTGNDAHLWGWLTGRSGPEGLTGADDLRMPLL